MSCQVLSMYPVDWRQNSSFIPLNGQLINFSPQVYVEVKLLSCSKHEPFFCGKGWFIDDLCIVFCQGSSRKRSSYVFLCDAVMPLITRHCLNLICKKDKRINRGCFVVIPVINMVLLCECVWLLAFINRRVSLLLKLYYVLYHGFL